MTGSYHCTCLTFLRNCHVVLPFCIPIINSYQSLHILITSWYGQFNFSSSRRGVVISHGFVCIFLMISDVEHVFMYLFAIWWSDILPIFKMNLFSYNWAMRVLFFFLDRIPLSDVCFEKIPPPHPAQYVACLLIF